METTDEKSLVDVPFEQLSSAALRGVIESFVLREGTDYGESEYDLPEKVGHVLQQLKKYEIKIVFDAKEESFDIRRVSKK